jgi:hypothetical protein
MLNLSQVSEQIIALTEQWNLKLLTLKENTVTSHRNEQDRNTKQILGHMVDSASNNTHRIIHLQYQDSPISFPDYANLGNNDRWIAIQNYEQSNWENLVNLWKYSHLHLAHVINQVDKKQFGKLWVSALNEEVSLENMIADFPRHMELHLNQIKELIAQ